MERLESRIASLTAEMDRWQRDLDATVDRSSRLEGAFSVLLKSLDGWRSDVREVAHRTEARVLRGLELIDSRIASLASPFLDPDKRDKQRSELQSRLDRIDDELKKLPRESMEGAEGRTAANQQAWIRSVERLWRSLRTLEDKLEENSKVTNQVSERLARAERTIGDAVEQVRAQNASSASHAEKLMMEGMESLDSRFSQNLLAASEKLSASILALTKSLEVNARAAASSAEASEERLAAQIKHLESTLVDQVKAGLESIGRREERMLALILGGGPAAPAPDDRG